MPYKYYALTSSSATVKETLVDSFQALVNSQFAVASNLFTIREEDGFASGSYVDVKVRIDGCVDSTTGVKLGDDFKKIIFKDLSHPVALGNKYYFDECYWIVTFSEKIKSLSNSCTVRRCNNVLRWMDGDENLYEEPCVIDYTAKRNVNKLPTTDPVTSEGYIAIYSQLNTKTRKLKPNQRFIFGYGEMWTSLYIFGFGIRNFDNLTTIDNDSAQLLAIEAGMSYINKDVDNLSLGIADYFRNVYALSPSPSTISGSAGTSVEIFPNITLNDVPVIKEMTYSSSASTIATVSGSNLGLVSLVSNGSATISMYATGTSASTTVHVVVSASSVMAYEIRFSPSDNYVLEGDTTIFSVYGYRNGSLLADTFAFALTDANVPGDNYTFTVIDDNHFSIKNTLMYLSYPLIISATSGVNEELIEISLRGAW